MMKNTWLIITIKLIIHLIKIDNLISSPTDFQQKCRLSVGLFFPKGIPQAMLGTLDYFVQW